MYRGIAGRTVDEDKRFAQQGEEDVDLDHSLCVWVVEAASDTGRCACDDDH